ncbi:MAG TPA: response regulator transcription factor [Solirubrobacterales bacterium]|nr:response regulator transcription factor [Solirubrobacterales bacterium]
MNQRILIVEDEPGLSSFLVKGLKANGFAIGLAEDGRAALSRAGNEDFDLIILDLGLPDIDGLEVLSEMRGQGIETPVVILTARDDLSDKVSGLDGGADDYVTKPFRFEELMARIRVRLRGKNGGEATTLSAAGVDLDLHARTASCAGSTIELTSREFTMLETFMRHEGQVLSREQLLSHVWGYDYDPGSNVVDVYIGYLRRKLPNGRIRTVRGTGYRLAGPDTPDEG